MAQPQFTTEELAMLSEGISTLIASAKRAQNTSKSPQIKEVYLAHEKVLQTLLAKIPAKA